MAFDGLVTYAISKELAAVLTQGRIDKIHQPSPEQLVIHVYTHSGNVKLFATTESQGARVCLTNAKLQNPAAPPSFCMLLRKHLSGSRITDVRQFGSDRIIEIDIEALTEMGFTTSRRLIFEIMGKHSNIILLDLETNKIIDCIKRISIDVNRYRQLLPGAVYKYPPKQDRVPFKDATPEDIKSGNIISCISGISPAMARELEAADSPFDRLRSAINDIESGSFRSRIYSDNEAPREFYITDLKEFDDTPEISRVEFDTISECAEAYFASKASTNIIKQKSQPLAKTVKLALEKAQLKKQRLSEDLLRAENSEKYRIYGELLTANIHAIKPGDKSVVLTSYYDGEDVEIPLDEKLSAAKNAQKYFKKYSKAKTAVKEKSVQLYETENDIRYLESVLQSIETAATEAELDQIREELIETGYVRYRNRPGTKKKKAKPSPIKYELSDGHIVYVGRNNVENDYVTTKLADRGDIWYHTKDIPGSHVVLRLFDDEDFDSAPVDLMYEVASIAAYHSKAKASENVPVDFVQVKHVKKPHGAKPGMVIFTHNTTVWVEPKLPLSLSSTEEK